MPKRSVPTLETAQQQLINDLIPTARSHRLSWSGGETQLLEAGEGLPLLFIHGGLSQATEWLPLWPQLQVDFKLLAIDRPGHGLATPYDFRGVDTLALADQFLAEMVALLGLKQPVLVANSMGARWALEYAVRRPNQVGRLILVGAPAGISPRLPNMMLALRWPLTRPLMRLMFRHANANSIRQFAAQLLVAHPEKIPESFLLAKAAGQRRHHTSLLTFAQRIMAYRTIHPAMLLAEKWSQIHTPTDFIWGEADAFHGPAEGKALLAQIPAATSWQLIPGAGHLPWMDAPAAVARAIRAATGSRS